MVKFLHIPSSILKYREKGLKLVNVYYSIVSNGANLPIPPSRECGRIYCFSTRVDGQSFFIDQVNDGATHTRTVLSSPAVAMYFPSGDQAKASTFPECSRNV